MKTATIVKTMFDFLKNCGVNASFKWKQEHYVKDKVSGASVYAQQIADPVYGRTFTNYGETITEEDGEQIVEIWEDSSQYFLTTIQVDTYIPYNTTNAVEMDSREMARKLKTLLQSMAFAEYLQSIDKSAGIRQISNVRDIQQQDESNRGETVGSFDVVISHCQTERITSAKVTRTEYHKLVV